MKKQLVTIGLVQSKVSSDLDVNLKKTVEMVELAAKKGAQIICLQELFRTPYFPQKRGVKKDKYAETIPGETTQFMGDLAKKLSIELIVPIFENAKDGSYYNTAVVFNTDGKILGKYHKIHIPQDPGFYEKDYFEASTAGYKIFKTKFATFAVLICYDQWFPEAARAARLAGAQIIFYPSAIADIIDYDPPEGNWQDAWETVMRGHAIANSVPIAAVNRVGVEGKSDFFGSSFVCDAFGKILKRASKNSEEVVVTQVDLAMNKYISDDWGFMRNRRLDTYKSLTENILTENSKELKNIDQYAETKKALGEK